jgi:hypothetical protein
MSGAFPDDTTLATVIATLDQLDFAPGDGVRYFNELYAGVTREVAAQIAAGAFHDPGFMTTLDVIFAGLYVDAVRAPDTACRAWRALFDRRFARLEPLRFALAGMNAHINRDLAVALDLACTRLGGALDRGSPRCADYVQVNAILEQHMAEAKAELFSTADQVVDVAMGKLDDLLEIWSITAARDTAWTHGAALHREDAAARDHQLTSLDRTASLIGRLILL